MAGIIGIHALTGIGEVEPGANLAEILAGALRRQELTAGPNDVLCVTSKIVSKAEGRFVALDDVVPGAKARQLADKTAKDPRLVELVLAESAAVVRAVPGVLITRHRLGFVMANAGIDQSNLGPGGEGRVLLLPRDPDGAAAGLREALSSRFGMSPAIVISDSFGRPWRMGVVNVALGASGLPALLDSRGMADRDGRTLQVTQIALADTLASAAGLACGEGAEGVPAALVRGCQWLADENPAAALNRPIEQDLFQ